MIKSLVGLCLLSCLVACKNDFFKRSGSSGTPMVSSDIQSGIDATTSGSTTSDTFDDDLATDDDLVTDDEVVDTYALKVKGLRLDSSYRNGKLMLVFQTSSGIVEAAWPSAGQEIEVADVCTLEAAEYEVSVKYKGSTYSMSNQQCFIGKQADNGALHLGFEDDCDSSKYSGIDDAIATFSCGDMPVVFKDLRVDDSIVLHKWID